MIVRTDEGKLIEDSEIVTYEGEFFDTFQDLSRNAATYISDRNVSGFFINVSFQAEDGTWRWYRTPHKRASRFQDEQALYDFIQGDGVANATGYNKPGILPISELSANAVQVVWW